MKAGSIRIFLFALSCLLVSPLRAQFKILYPTDTVEFQSMSQWKVGGMCTTDLPGREIVITGNFTGQEAGGTYVQPYYIMLLDTNGAPQQFSYHNDTAQFIFAGAKSYGVTYGNGKLYVAGGSNNFQTIMAHNADGSPSWAMHANHHDFYDVMVDSDGSVIGLGQDESITGIHDYSLVRLDTSGMLQSGMMVGTVDFDLPERVVKGIGGGYVLAGGGRDNGHFTILLYKMDQGFNVEWSNFYQWPTESNVIVKALSPAANNDGYVVSGYIDGAAPNPDTSFALKVDQNGDIAWAKGYTTAGTPGLQISDMEADPDDGSYIYCGAWKDADFYKGTVFKTDSLGKIVWARDHGPTADSTEEYLREIVLPENSDRYYAAGESNRISGFFLYPKLLMVSASRDSGFTPCDKALNITETPVSFTRIPILHTEGFFAYTAIGFTYGTTSIDSDAVCFQEVIIHMDEAYETNDIRVLNPASDYLDIRFEAEPGHEALAKIYSLDGRILHTEKIRMDQGEHRISVEGMSSGIYLIEFIPDNRTAVYKKIILQ